MNDAPYSRVRDINLMSASALKARLDNKIDSLTFNESSTRSAFQSDLCSSGNAPHENVQVPTIAEINDFCRKLNDFKVKFVALSLVSQYKKEFILPNHNIPSIPELFEPSLLELSYPDLLKKCFEIKLTLSSEQVCQVEKDTYVQVCTQMRKLRFLRKIAKIVNGAKKKTNPQLGLEIFAIFEKIATFRNLHKNR